MIETGEGFHGPEDSPEIQKALELFCEFERIMERATTFSEGTREIWKLGSQSENQPKVEALDTQHFTVVVGYLQQHARIFREQLVGMLTHMRSEQLQELQNQDRVKDRIIKPFIQSRMAALMEASIGIQFNESGVRGKTQNAALTTAGRTAVLYARLLQAGKGALLREAIEIIREHQTTRGQHLATTS